MYVDAVFQESHRGEDAVEELRRHYNGSTAMGKR
jgi:hypothetical protein